jgi:hypothetical protein
LLFGKKNEKDLQQMEVRVRLAENRSEIFIKNQLVIEVRLKEIADFLGCNY